MNLAEEKVIINKILKGDTNSFGYFVDNYQDMAITIAYRICLNKQDAEDIVQNSFIKAFHNLQTFRTYSKFSTWFYRIVYNTAITHINSSIFSYDIVDYNEIKNQENTIDINIIEQIDKEEKSKIINKAIERLPHDESLLISFFYLEENSIKDISLITGLSESNIKVKLHRGRKKLAEEINRMIKVGDLK